MSYKLPPLSIVLRTSSSKKPFKENKPREKRKTLRVIDFMKNTDTNDLSF